MTLAVIIVLQALCAAFFVGDIVSDVALGVDDRTHSYFEALATLVLILGVIFLMIELRGVVGRLEQMNRGLRAAQGEMAAIIEGFFDDWRLTPSEKDVGLLILKGFDNDTIAEFRGTAAGTVRAQSARIYSKAGVAGRVQLISVLLEELLAGEVQPPQPVSSSIGNGLELVARNRGQVG